MYSRWIIERVLDSDARIKGWKVHIEVFLPNKDDAIAVMNKYAKQITEENIGDNVRTRSVNSSA